MGLTPSGTLLASCVLATHSAGADPPLEFSPSGIYLVEQIFAKFATEKPITEILYKHWSVSIGI